MKTSFCRICPNSCPVLVEVEDGRAVKVTGDPSNDIYQGYTCVKGRKLPELHNHPDRLLHHQKRMPDGTYVPISSEQLLDELAERVRGLIDESGPNAIATYIGTMATVSPTIVPMMTAFNNAIGSTMTFNPMTIDQPGKGIAKGLHGAWMAPAQAFNTPDVGLLFGANPLVTYAMGLPAGHPGKWLQRWSDEGLQLIVVDPRRTDTAKRAKIHLQCRPGHDVEILAAIIRVIVTEGRQDHAFVAANVDGVEALAAAVAPYTPELVAARAGIDAAELVEAARIFAGGSRGIACAGTGPNMSGSGTLLEYLLLCLTSLCGNWLREGDVVHNPPVVTPARAPKAQASGPFPAWGLTDPLPGTDDVRGSLAGLPTGSAPTSMLHDGNDRIRALISVGGNPAASWPDQLHAVEGLRALDLLVQVDIWMSTTARLADYVVAAKMSLETPGVTMLLDTIALAFIGSGSGAPWTQWADPAVDVPPGSDLLEEWELFYGLGQRLGLQYEYAPMAPGALAPMVLDMENKPSTESLIEYLCTGGRISLDEVRSHPGGAMYPDPPVVVGPKDADWAARFDLGNADMMRDLGALLDRAVGDDDEGRPFRMITRRVMHRYNSSMEQVKGKMRPYNPAFLHPDDLAQLGLESGDLAEICSSRASITAVVEADPTVRRGMVSMSHMFGALPGEPEDPRLVGANTGRLLQADRNLDRYSGQPRMSNVAVDVRPVVPVA